MLSLLCFIAFTTFGQDTLKVPLTTKLMDSPTIPRTTSPINFRPDYDGYNGIPADLEKAWVGRQILQMDQYLYNGLLKRDSLGNRYHELLIARKTDTLQLSTTLVKSHVGILSGVKGSKKRIIVDVNNNHDFSDDAAFEYDMTDSTYLKDQTDYSFYPTLNVQFESFKNGKISPATAYLKVRPFDEAYGYKNPVDLQRAVYVTRFYYKTGNFKYGGENYKVSVAFRYGVFEEDFNRASYNINPVDQMHKYGLWLRKGVNYHLDSSLFEVVGNSSNGDTLHIKTAVAPERTVGWQLGDYAPNLTGNNTDGEFIDLDKTYRYQKPIVIDFWGSWCAPCLEEIPELTKLFNKKPSLNLISIHVEYNPEGITKAKKIINDKQMKWVHIPEIWSEGGGIKDKLAVNTFPTLIMIDQDGKIIFREEGLGSVAKLRLKLAEM